jgi:Dolichyl-phosphate-mannose-protein mannosyltransferase
MGIINTPNCRNSISDIRSWTNAQFLLKLDHVAEALGDYCERWKLLLLCSFSILYLASTCLVASQKLLWNDELFTFYIARVPNIHDIWSLLLTGGEQIPPVFHIITRISLLLFGVNELTIRLPEVVGFWVMSLCLFRFVSNRCSSLHGFAAMLFPLVTAAYNYAYEARPYGIVLGFGGLSLVCWQSVGDGHHRTLSLTGLALSLAAAVSSHYYAVLLFFPLAVGEVTRSLSRRRLDPPVWVAFGFAMTPLLLFLPLIQAAKTYSAHFSGQPHWGEILDCYYWLLTPALLPLVGLLILSAVYSTTHAVSPNSQNEEPRSAPAFYEVTAALGFTAIPVVAVILAMLVTGAFTVRYVLPSVIGFSILFAFAAYRLLDGRAIIGASLVVLLCSAFVMGEVRNFRRLVEASLDQAKTYEFLRSDSESKLPIVASDLHAFMQLAHYAPRDVASRLVYLANAQASLRYLGHSSVDQGILDLKPWFRLNVEEYAPYVASQQRFLVYVRGRYLNKPNANINWLVSDLTTDSRRIELRSRYKDDLLFLVSNR